MSVPTLTTERLTLRPWRPDDAEYMFDILRRREVTEWLGDPSPMASLEQAALRIDARIHFGTAKLPGSRAVVPHDVGHPVGAVMLDHLPGDSEVQIGWYLHPDHTGRGYATEAAHAVLDEALTNGHPRIWAGMWAHNSPSAGVCLRLGMNDLGECTDPWYGTIEYPTSRLFCTVNPSVADVEDPVSVLERCVASAVFEHTTDHPPA